MKKKITIRYELNKRVKARVIKDVQSYPVYIKIIACRNNTKFRSIFYSEYYSDQDFERIEKNTKEIEDFLKITERIISGGEFDPSKLFIRTKIPNQ